MKGQRKKRKPGGGKELHRSSKTEPDNNTSYAKGQMVADIL